MIKDINPALINHIIEAVLEEASIIGVTKGECYVEVEEKQRSALIQHINNVLKYESEVCPECYNLIQEEDYLTDFESRLGHGCKEEVCYGFNCSSCGYEERF